MEGDNETRDCRTYVDSFTYAFQASSKILPPVCFNEVQVETKEDMQRFKEHVDAVFASLRYDGTWLN